jgi:hypothetical protein
MKQAGIERRQLLQSSAAWVAGAVAFVLAPRARAFEVQSVNPKSPLGLDYSNRCRAATDHAALKAELEAALAKDPSAASLSATCPLCGCPVVVTR